MKTSPLAATVLASLRREIDDGTIAGGAPLPSERALAERHSVSRTVVREAVGALVKEGLVVARDRCRPVVAPSRRIVSGARARHVGIWLWPYIDDYAASCIFRGIQSAAQGEDVRLVVATASGAAWEKVLDSEASFLRELADDPLVAGAILWYLGGERNLPALLEAKRRGLELVFIDRRPPEEFPCDFVGVDNRMAARAGVEHLLALGHRRIACVTNLERVSSVRERLAGYHRALADAGIEPVPDWIVPLDADANGVGREAAAALLERLLALSPRPTAIFAINDNTALRLHEAARERGIRVPEELSLVGFDGLLRWIPGGGHITTAVQDFARIGERAAELLFERMRREAPGAFRHVLLEAPIELHGSTAAPPAGD